MILRTLRGFSFAKVRRKYVPGHSLNRQAVTRVDSPVQVPPLASSISLTLVLVCWLVPHVVEQSASTQSPHLQSTKLQFLYNQDI